MAQRRPTPAQRRETIEEILRRNDEKASRLIERATRRFVPGKPTCRRCAGRRAIAALAHAATAGTGGGEG